MLQDSIAIYNLCSQRCPGEDVQPLGPKEYGDLAQLLQQAGKTPKDLFGFSQDDFAAVLGFGSEQTRRLIRLLERDASLGFELEHYQNMGIGVITRADAAYPGSLKKKLGSQCPPMFYYAGEMSLLERELVGYVGARTITQEDLDFTVQAVRKTTALGYGVVSGGAKGVDRVSGTEALLRGGICVEYLAGSMRKRLSSDAVKSISQGRLLLMSVAKPDAGFDVGMAMMRNRYIYVQSVGTVVVRSNLNKGGTWTGATDSLKHGWCPTLCRDYPYPGNRALIEQGAVPIDEDWDGSIPERMSKVIPSVSYEQTSLFGV